MKNTITLFFLFYLSLAFCQQLEIEKKAIKKQIDESGICYNNGEYKKSLYLGKQALVRSFKINDAFLIAHSYNAIGSVYDQFSESKRAIEFYKKALVYADKINNDALRNWLYSNLGSTYYYSNLDVPLGITYYKKSLYYAIKVKDSVQITYTKLNITSAYFSIDDYYSGHIYLNQVQNYVEHKGEQEAKLTYYGLLGLYNSYLNKPNIAEAYYVRSIELGLKNGLDSFVIDMYDNYVIHLKKFKQFARATDYELKSKQLTDKLYAFQKPTDLDDLAIQIELDEYKSQLEKIESKNEAQQKKIQDSKLTFILFLVILIVMLLFIYTLYKNNNYKKKLNAELTLANQELKKAKEIAEENSKLKTQFVSTISHELRTPLYGVIGTANMIMDEHKELVNNEYLRSLKFSARYLLALVNDILQMNKMEDKKLALEKTTFNLRQEILNIKKALQFIADRNNNKLTVTIDAAIPEQLIGDELRLSQILMNLVSNALKFTKNGEVIINVVLEKIYTDRYFITFTVKDDGIGIAKGNQQKIFDKFVQIERQEGDYQGTGLGLPIVKRLIELFGSKLQLESEENIGTTFTFTIDLAMEQNEKIPQDTRELEDLKELAVLNILVVEDNKINQMVTRKIIERNNHSCHIASNGFEALAMLEEQTFDVILMDINMPVLNGYETSAKIRELGIQIPIIALTAFDRREVMDEAVTAGINDVIVKPFEASQLFSIIKEQLKKM